MLVILLKSILPVLKTRAPISPLYRYPSPMPSKLELVTFYRFTVTVEWYEKSGGGTRGTKQRFPTFGTRSGHQSQQGLRCRWHVKQLSNIYFIDTLRCLARRIWSCSSGFEGLTQVYFVLKTCFLGSREMREKCLWSDFLCSNSVEFCFYFIGLLLLSDLLFWTNMPKIFLIKNRLHQQQLRLESQNAGNKNELGIGDPQPLSLIVQKKDGKKILLQTNICVSI